MKKLNDLLDSMIDLIDLFYQTLPPLYQNWFVHNMLGHPMSEIVYHLARRRMDDDKARDLSGWVHDLTIPPHEPGTGRG